MRVQACLTRYRQEVVCYRLDLVKYRCREGGVHPYPCVVEGVGGVLPCPYVEGLVVVKRRKGRVCLFIISDQRLQTWTCTSCFLDMVASAMCR